MNPTKQGFLSLVFLFGTLYHCNAQTGIPVIYEIQLETSLLGSPCTDTNSPVANYPISIEFGDSVEYLVYTDVNGIAYDTLYTPKLPQSNFRHPYPRLVRMLDSANIGEDRWNSMLMSTTDPYSQPYQHISFGLHLPAPYKDLENCAGFDVYAEPYLNNSRKVKFHHTYGTPALNAQWTFGDGSTSNEMFPVHIYSSPGTYTYCLDIGGCTTKCDTITVTAQNPAGCGTGISHSFIEESYVQLKSNLSAVDTNIMWTLSNGMNFSHHRPAFHYTGGTLRYCLTTSGCPIVCDTIFPPSSCNANFSWEQDSLLWVDVELNDFDTSNTYVWSYRDSIGSILRDTMLGSSLVGGRFTVEYPYYGHFQSGLEVLGAGNSCALEMCTTVSLNMPDCHASFYVDTAASGNGTLVIVNNSLAQNLPATSYLWTFGDSDSSMSYDPYPSHSYARSGAYKVCLKVTSNTLGNGYCEDIFCDTIGLDSTGTIFKSGEGFSINVVSPQEVGLAETGSEPKIAIYPNPTTGIVFIEAPSSVRMVKVFTLHGSETSRPIEIGSEAIDLGDLSAGVYLLGVVLENGTTQYKRVVLR